MLPLLFEHSTEAVGHIDPNSMRPTRAGLVAAGEVDRGSDHGKQVWRQIKSGSAGFSIGFAGDCTPQQGGGVRGPTSTCSKSPPPRRRCTRPYAH